MSNDSEHAAFRLPSTLRLALPGTNRLRKNSPQVIYYGNALFDVWCFKLLPSQVVCLSLFNGQRTLDEVVEFLAFLGDYSKAEAEVNVRHFLKSLDYPGTNSFIEVEQSSDKNFLTFDCQDFLISPTKRTLRLDVPISLVIMPTDKCLTDCEYCYACRKPVPNDQLLKTSRILELIDEAHNLGIINISLNGGDIFANSEHMIILEHTLEYGIEPGISTKGYISKDKAKELARIGLKWLQVGLDSTREMCDKLVRRSGYFDRTVETIYNLTDEGIRVRTNSIITNESLRFLPELVDFLMTLPLFDIKVASAFLGLYRGNEQMLLSAEQKNWYQIGI